MLPTEMGGRTDIIDAKETVTTQIITDRVKMTDANRLTDDGEKTVTDTTNISAIEMVGIMDTTVAEDTDKSFLSFIYFEDKLQSMRALLITLDICHGVIDTSLVKPT